MKPVIFHSYLIVVYQRVEYFQDGTNHFQVSNVSASGGWWIPRSKIWIFHKTTTFFHRSLGTILTGNWMIFLISGQFRLIFNGCSRWPDLSVAAQKWLSFLPKQGYIYIYVEIFQTIQQDSRYECLIVE